MTNFSKIIGVSLVLGLLVSGLAATPAQAAKCRNAGTKFSNVKVGSQVDGDLLTICASKKLIKQLIKKTKVAPAPKSTKPATSKPKSQPKPAAKPKPVLKPKPKPKSKIRVSKSVHNNSGVALFRPRKPAAIRTPLGTLAVGQTVQLKVAKTTTDGFTRLLGQLVRVKFVPKQVTWSFGDTRAASGFSASHAFAAAGNYWVVARVRYKVSYKLASGAWLADPDPIWLSTKPLSIPVGVYVTENQNSKTLLVQTH